VTEEGSGRSIRVIDRRWFTAEGDLREPLPAVPGEVASTAPCDAPEVVEPPCAPEALTARDGDPPEEVEAGGVDLRLASGVGFIDLVDALVQPAYALLTGQITGGSPNLEGARHYIDLLEVLGNKTRGRLSVQEAKVLDDALYQMRSLYLAATR
jgi:hypothetical protein